MFAPRARMRDLVHLCRRVSTSLEAGIDLRRIFSREATSYAPRAMQRHLEHVRNEVAQGRSLADALADTGSYFPVLFHELVRIGEETGHLDQALAQLAEHYEAQERLRRDFLSSISWPAIELGMALGVVGLLIWIMGFLEGRDLRGQPLDLLGFGLRGTDGLLRYLALLGGVALIFAVLYQAARREMFWAKPLQRLVLYVPKLGGALRTLALARLAWSMQLTLGAGVSLLRALPLCLRSTHNVTYSEQAASVTEAVRRGETVTEAFSATRCFPRTFLDTLDVGERSGRLPETMAIVARQYHEEARLALALITRIAGFGVWLCVAGLIVFLIFRIFSFYLGQLNAVL